MIWAQLKYWNCELEGQTWTLCVILILSCRVGYMEVIVVRICLVCSILNRNNEDRIAAAGFL